MEDNKELANLFIRASMALGGIQCKLRVHLSETEALEKLFIKLALNDDFINWTKENDKDTLISLVENAKKIANGELDMLREIEK